MKKYRIDKDRNIGNVIFVVEGGRAESGGTELRLLRKIFADILEYNVQELRRGCDEFIAHGINSQFHVFALNLPRNQLTSLDEDSLDLLYQRIKEEFEIKPEDCPVFFLYDRDVLSYKKNELQGRYVKRYSDPYGTEQGDQGQLLLSYPAIESFLLSCIQDKTYMQNALLGREAKSILSEKVTVDGENDQVENHLQIVDIIFTNDTETAETRLIHALNEMDIGLEALGISEYDLDNLGPTTLKLYQIEQSKFEEEKTFSFMSLVGMSLLELGVIVEEEN